MSQADIPLNKDQVPSVDGLQVWAPVFALVADGSRIVQRVVDWIGGAGAKPLTGGYIGSTGYVASIGDAVNVRGVNGTIGVDGAKGDNGWSPVFASVMDGDRNVLKVVDWTGGAGVKPSANVYLGPTGFTSSIGEAVSVRGADGARGDTGATGARGSDGFNGWSPTFALLPWGDKVILKVTAWTGGSGTAPATAGWYLGDTGLVNDPNAATDLRGYRGLSGNDGSPGAPGAPGIPGTPGAPGPAPRIFMGTANPTTSVLTQDGDIYYQYIP